MEEEIIEILLSGMKYRFKTGERKKLNLYGTIPVIITEIKSPGRLRQERFLEPVAELKRSSCRYYKECSNYPLTERWWNFACVDCIHCGGKIKSLYGRR